MANNLVFEKIKTLLDERFAIEPSLVLLTADLHKDLGLDSMDSVDLLLAVNETFGIQVRPEALSDIHTIQDLVTAIEKKTR